MSRDKYFIIFKFCVRIFYKVRRILYKNREFCTKLLTFENFDVMLVVFGW